jgi:hypothetical protein
MDPASDKTDPPTHEEVVETVTDAIMSSLPTKPLPNYALPAMRVVEALMFYAPKSVHKIIDVIRTGHGPLTASNARELVQNLGVTLPADYDMRLINDPVYQYLKAVKRLGPKFVVPGPDAHCWSVSTTANSGNDPAYTIVCKILGSECTNWINLGTAIKDGNKLVTGVGHMRLKNPAIVYDPHATRERDSPDNWRKMCLSLYRQLLTRVTPSKRRPMKVKGNFGGLTDPHRGKFEKSHKAKGKFGGSNLEKKVQQVTTNASAGACISGGEQDEYRNTWTDEDEAAFQRQQEAQWGNGEDGQNDGTQDQGDYDEGDFEEHDSEGEIKETSQEPREHDRRGTRVIDEEDAARQRHLRNQDWHQDEFADDGEGKKEADEAAEKANLDTFNAMFHLNIQDEPGTFGYDFAVKSQKGKKPPIRQPPHGGIKKPHSRKQPQGRVVSSGAHEDSNKTEKHSQFDWGQHELFCLVVEVSEMAAALQTLVVGGTLSVKLRIFRQRETHYITACLATLFEDFDLVPAPAQRASFVLAHYRGKKDIDDETLDEALDYLLNRCADGTMEIFNPPTCCIPSKEALDKVEIAAVEMQHYHNDSYHIFATAVRILQRDMNVPNAFKYMNSRNRDTALQISLTDRLRIAMQVEKKSLIWEELCKEV